MSMTNGDAAQTSAGPLTGVKIIDMTSVVAGPYATQMLGDLGADIIKVEAPEGDATRYTGPSRHPDMAALFMGINRNKRSIVLDLKKPSGRDLLLRLIDSADVLIHNVRPQKLEKLGLDSQTVLARKPDLIFAGVHGWREDGPYGGRPAYDDIIQGVSGVAGLMQDLTGEPRYTPTILADKTSGMMAVQAIIAALYQREKTGIGQAVEIPMFETMVSFVMVEHLFGRCFSPPIGKAGYSRVLAPWRRPYKTADGWVCMMAYTDLQWRRLFEICGRPELATDPRFCSLAARSQNINEVYRFAGEELLKRTTVEWLRLLDQNEIPAGAMRSIDDLMHDPHLDAIGFFRHETHPTEGEIVMSDIPVRFSKTPGSVRHLQPRLGEHGREILSEVGLSSAEIESAASAGGLVLGKAELA
jgi:crotonobetainyl-CoA:carnitine CoA-transferase CaiB-like acyl-CoA transferase